MARVGLVSRTVRTQLLRLRKSRLRTYRVRCKVGVRVGVRIGVRVGVRVDVWVGAKVRAREEPLARPR